MESAFQRASIWAESMWMKVEARAARQQDSPKPPPNTAMGCAEAAAGMTRAAATAMAAVDALILRTTNLPVRAPKDTMNAAWPESRFRIPRGC